MRSFVAFVTVLCLNMGACVMETEELDTPPSSESLGQTLENQTPGLEGEGFAPMDDERDMPVEQSGLHELNPPESERERPARPDPCPWRVPPTSTDQTVERSNPR
jgi:hypothetical protein